MSFSSFKKGFGALAALTTINCVSANYSSRAISSTRTNTAITGVDRFLAAPESSRPNSLTPAPQPAQIISTDTKTRALKEIGAEKEGLQDDKNSYVACIDTTLFGRREQMIRDELQLQVSSRFLDETCGTYIQSSSSTACINGNCTSQSHTSVKSGHVSGVRMLQFSWQGSDACMRTTVPIVVCDK